jgi:prepilin-type N-terminal cleavage/methylation domain-containing protein
MGSRAVKERIKISRAGKLNKDGFTLIELTVVVFLIGLMLLVAVPRVRDAVLTDEIKSAVNYISNTSVELRNSAVRDQIDYVINMNLDEGLIYTYSTDMTPEAIAEVKKNAYRLPGNVRIADVHRFGKEKISEGEITIKIFKKGYAQPAAIHLVRGDDSFTLVLSPFLKDIETYDRYVEYEYSD